MAIPSVTPRVTLVIASLCAGGAERVLSTMANYWAQRGRYVALVTLDSTATDFYSLRPEVERFALSVSGRSRTPVAALRNNVRRLGHVRRALRATKPDIVIAFMSPAPTSRRCR